MFEYVLKNKKSHLFSFIILTLEATNNGLKKTKKNCLRTRYQII